MFIAATGWSVGETLGVVGFVLTVLVAAVVYRLQRKTKFIEWIVFSEGPLIWSKKEWSGLEVLHGGVKLDDPRHTNLTIYNLTHEAIRQDDWDSPITITFPNATVASVTTSTNSDDFVAEADIEDHHSVVIRPLLMNYFDKVSLSILVDGDTEGMELTCRIVGQTRTPKRGSLRAPKPSLWSRLPRPIQVIVGAVVFMVWLGNAIGLIYRAIH